MQISLMDNVAMMGQGTGVADAIAVKNYQLPRDEMVAGEIRLWIENEEFRAKNEKLS